jgi:hypothetical protein
MNRVTTMISHSEKYNTYSPITEWDICVGCDSSRVKELCRNCGHGVCNEKQCCQIFPHVNGTNYAICKSCTRTIEKKLVAIVNHDELRLLKKKIHSRIKRTIEKIESSE